MLIFVPKLVCMRISISTHMHRDPALSWFWLVNKFTSSQWLGRADQGRTFRIPRLGRERKGKEEGDLSCQEERKDTTPWKGAGQRTELPCRSWGTVAHESCLTRSRATKMEYRI